MNSQLLVLAVAACACVPSAWAANGSVAATMVKHASARRMEALQKEALNACALRPAADACAGGPAPAKDKVKKT